MSESKYDSALVEQRTELTKERLSKLNALETEVKADFSPVLNQINQDKELNLKTRENGFHITIISPTENKILKNLTDEQMTELQEINKEIQNGEGIIIDGLGFIDGSQKENLRDTDKNKKVLFLAFSIPKLQEFRKSVGLSEKDFHITLGFEENDIHMEIVGQNEKGKPILKPISKKADSSLAEYMSLISDLRFGQLSGQEKQKKAESKKEQKAILYNAMLVEKNLKSLPEGILEEKDMKDFVEMAENGDVDGINKRLKDLGPQLRQNMKFVKDAFKNSEV